jgi:RNA polymerase sigma factor (sigma-70 family)
VINTLEYLQKGLLDIEKIKDGVQSARVGQCHFGLGYQAKLYENSAELFLRDEQKNLLWYIMQLEAWIFSVDSNYSPESILHAIITKKEVIRKTIETTQKKYKRIGAPKLRKLGVYCFMSRLRFAELRKELGIICSHEDGKPKQCDIEPLAVPKAPERGTGCFSDTYTESEAINDYDQEWGDFEEDEYDWEVSELLRKYLKTFSQIEKRVFILDSCDELTVNEIASTLKLSEAQVSEILRKISDHLRTTRE